MIQNFSKLTTVPQATDMIDSALNSTNRKTPTVIRSKMDVHRIRRFYLRKVNYGAEQFCSRLRRIVDEFPIIEDLHPFYMDLVSVLYDRDHYKIALGQVNAARHAIERIEKEHERILNFGDSQYRCKQLKKSALGRMATTVKKLSKPLAYLEEVRQHMSRLPSVDTQARTLIICGFPNVGKSSFMNSVSRADVEVENYAFTTRNIYLGHFEYKGLSWQVVDTPGILDKPLVDRNSVEMLSITALAHLRAAVLFFIDVSETCGYTVEEQITLYQNLTPLLNKEILIVLSKMDLVTPEQRASSSLTAFLAARSFVELSVNDEAAVAHVRETICDMLLSVRLEEKKSRRDEFIHRIRPYMPTNVVTDAYNNQPTFNNNINTMDFIVPEIYAGKNISDFVRPGLAAEVNEIEKEMADEQLRMFDVMTESEREAYVVCNNARLDAVARSRFTRRNSVPESWKNPRLPDAPLLVNHVPKIQKESHNRRARPAGAFSNSFYTKNPRHIVRPKGNKFSKK